MFKILPVRVQLLVFLLLCCLENKDIDHMLERCPALRCVRNQYLAELKGCLQQHLGVYIRSENFRDRNVMLQQILDCTKLVPKILPAKRDFLLRIETHARLLCYKFHLKRLYLHKAIKADSGEQYSCQPLLLTIYITEQNLKGN